MKNNLKDKRKNPRIIFSLDDGIVGSLIVPHVHKKPITAYILNLSLGGIYFTLRSDQSKDLNKGDIFSLTEIKQWGSENFVLNIDAEIKWKLDNKEMQYISLGCEFKKIPDTSKQNLVKFMEAKRSLRKMK